jgi:hypothetical protein
MMFWVQLTRATDLLVAQTRRAVPTPEGRSSGDGAQPTERSTDGARRAEDLPPAQWHPLGVQTARFANRPMRGGGLNGSAW